MQKIKIAFCTYTGCCYFNGRPIKENFIRIYRSISLKYIIELYYFLG